MGEGVVKIKDEAVNFTADKLFNIGMAQVFRINSVKMIDGDVFKTITELNKQGPEMDYIKDAVRTGLKNLAEEYLEKKR